MGQKYTLHLTIAIVASLLHSFHTGFIYRLVTYHTYLAPTMSTEPTDW